MKKIVILFALFVSGLLFHIAIAQERVSINIVNQPLWGPVGYDYVEYYYMPEIESYYFVPTGEYIYLEKGQWITASRLPRKYRSYNMYRTIKYVVNEPQPYLHHAKYKEKFNSRGNHSGQPSIRDSREPKYFIVKNHPKHSTWKAQNKSQGHSKKSKNGKNKH